MIADDLVGFVPEAVDPERGLVSLIAAGSVGFNEPFYRLTLAGLGPGVRRRTLSFAELSAALGDERPAPAPAGLVLHTSRCGSTLLAKMLRHDRTRLVLSEPSPVAAAHKHMLDAPSDAHASALFTDLLALLDQFAAGRRQRILIKLTSWQAISLPQLAERFPNTPLVFVHRPAHEVVASLVANPPGWAPEVHGGPSRDVPGGRDGGGLPAAVLEGIAGIDPSLDAVEFYAAVWSNLVRAALDAPAERLMLVSYTDLVHDAGAVLEQLAVHLSSGDAFDPKRAAREMDYYAKAANPTERFEPEGQHRRPALTDDQLTRIDAIVGDLPARLAERAAQRASGSQAVDALRRPTEETR